MKKFTILSLLVAFSAFIFAQSNSSTGSLWHLPKLPEAQLKPGYKDNTVLGPEYSLVFQEKSLKATGDTIWANDFSNPDDWEPGSNTGDCQQWIICTPTPVNNCTQLYGITYLVSPTASNGIALFNSDYTGTLCGNEDDGIIRQDAWLTTADPIDMSNNIAVQIEFYNKYRRWEDTCYVEVSTDNNTWIPFLVNDVGQGNAGPAYIKVNITSAAANQPQVWFRFRFRGDWDYAWMLDDLVVTEAPDYDLVLNVGNIPYYYQNTGFVYMLPKYYLGWYRPGAEIENTGNLPQDNVSLNLNIVNETGMEVYDWTTDSIGVWDNATKDTIWMDSLFEPPFMKAEYTATFTTFSDATEQAPGDNSTSISFITNDSVYAHDHGTQTGVTSPSVYIDAADGDAMGLSYFVPIDDTVSSVSVFIDYRTTPGTIITAEVWRYDAVIQDRILIIDSEEHIIQPEDIDNWVTLKLTSEDGLQEYITGNDWYDAVISCTWGQDTLWFGNDMSHPNHHAYQFETVLRLGTTWYYTTRTPMVRLNMFRNPAPQCDEFVLSVDFTNVTCFGANDGTATAFAAGGDYSFTYLWSTDSINSTLTGLTQGTYTVTVTTCAIAPTILIESITISAPAEALSVVESFTNPSCVFDNGTIELSISGGGIPYYIEWSTGETSANLDNLAEGTYLYTVTDNFGCEITGDVTLADSSDLAITYVVTDILCHDDGDGSIDLTITGGATPYTIEWVTGDTIEDLSNLDGGTYTVTVTDDNGCNVTGAINVFEPAALEASFDVSNISCFGEINGAIDLTVSGGTDPYSFLWSTSDTTEDINNLAQGIYIVIITDDNGCTLIDSTTITEPVLLQVTSLVGTDATCNGSATGSADLTVIGGTQPYTYLWSPNGATIPDPPNLTANTYYVTITDANGCEAFDSVGIEDDPEIILSISVIDADCEMNNGSATVTPTGGVPPYIYLWNNLQTDSIAIDLLAGIYNVIVTDYHGCTESINATVNNITTLVAEITSSTNNLCYGDCDGDATVTINGGTLPYEYLWNDTLAQTTLTAVGLCAGDYTVTVFDSIGCQSFDIITITEPAAINSTHTATMVSCFGGSNGAIDIDISGGTPEYSYLWPDSTIADSISELAAGIYVATITDANGCTLTDITEITEPTAIEAPYTATMISCYGSGNGAIDLDVSGGTQPYTFLWSNSDTTYVSEDLDSLTADIYYITITDDNDCSLSDSIEITEPVALSTLFSDTMVSCNGGNDGVINLEVNGGTLPYLYLWNTPIPATTEDLDSLDADSYIVVITDAHNCTLIDTTEITEPAALAITHTYTNPWGGNDNGTINITASGGTSPYTYLWNDSITTEDRIGLAAGTYS
ncbi:MAG: SprB repeat-containing protein, partial [Bacteroidia bacterium]|nr:SprB repeat-containing protein [Bacteroidia bacterium]